MVLAGKAGVADHVSIASKVFIFNICRMHFIRVLSKMWRAETKSMLRIWNKVHVKEHKQNTFLSQVRIAAKSGITEPGDYAGFPAVCCMVTTLCCRFSVL